MVLFGEHLSNKVVILLIHYSSVNWCCSQKKQLSLPQLLIPAAMLVLLCLYSLLCVSVADLSRELVLVDTNLGNTKLLVLRWISHCPDPLALSGAQNLPLTQGEGIREWEICR